MEPKEPGTLSVRKHLLRAALTALVITACTPEVKPRAVDIQLTEMDRLENLPLELRRGGVRIRTRDGIYTTEGRFYQELQKLGDDPSVCLVRILAPGGRVGLRRSYREVKPACRDFDISQ